MYGKVYGRSYGRLYGFTAWWTAGSGTANDRPQPAPAILRLMWAGFRVLAPILMSFTLRGSNGTH